MAFRCLVDAEGERADDGPVGIEESYARSLSDEFVRPMAIGDYAGMADGDGLLMVNFRADRARQILTALTDNAFDGFTRKRMVKFAALAGMADYSKKLSRRLPTLFASENLSDTLGDVVSRAGLKQLRIAETEKYAHVTFFLNGGREREFNGEDRILVPSPKVATYDLKPQMSAEEVTDRLVEAIETGANLSPTSRAAVTMISSKTSCLAVSWTTISPGGASTTSTACSAKRGCSTRSTHGSSQSR